MAKGLCLGGMVMDLKGAICSKELKIADERACSWRLMSLTMAEAQVVSDRCDERN